MPKDLPEFQNAVPIQTLTLPDVQVAQSALSTKLEKFATTFEKVVAIKEHQEAVQAKAQEKEQLAAEKLTTQTQIRDSYSGLRNKILDPERFNDQALTNYDAQATGIAQGILSNVSPKLRPFVENSLSYYSTRSRDMIAGRVRELGHQQLKAGLQESVHGIGNDAVNAEMANEQLQLKDGTVVSKADMFMGQANNAIKQGLNSGVLTANEATNMQDSLNQTVEEAKYVSQFNNVLRNTKANPQNWLDQFNKSKQVDPVVKNKVNIKAVSAMDHLQTQQRHQQVLIKEEANDVVTQVTQGILKANSPTVDNLKTRMGILPKFEQDNIIRKINTADIINAAASKLKWVSPAKRQIVIDKMAPDPTKAGFSFKNKLHTQLQTISNKLESEFKKDPFGYVITNPAVHKAFDARMVAPQDGRQIIQPPQVQSIDPFAVAIQQEKELGAVDHAGFKGQTVTSVIGKPQATAIVAQLDQFPETPDGIKEKAQFIDQLAQTYGAHRDIASRDLARAGAPQNIMDLAGLERVPAARPYLQSIYDAISQPDEIKKRLKINDETGIKFSDFQNAAAGELQPLFDTYGNTKDSVQFKNNMINLVATGAAQYSLNKSDKPESSIPKIANAIYLSRYSAILNGARIRGDISVDNAKSAMFAMQRNISDVQFDPLTRDPTNAALAPQTIAQEDMDAIKAGSWRTISGDKGLYWVDANGFTPYLKGTKKRYEILWSDLKNPTSELHEVMSKHPRTFLGKLGLDIKETKGTAGDEILGSIF